MRERLGIAPRPCYTEPVQRRPYSRRTGAVGPVEAQYAYTDTASGQPLRKTRHAGKTFTWESQDAAGRWQRGRQGLSPGVYHQDTITAAPAGALVFWCGGEKGCDAIRDRGELASANPDGDTSWTPDFAEAVRDKVVMLLPDNDDAGRRFAQRFAADVAGIARRCYIVELPGLAAGEDAYDFVERGGTVEQIVRLALDAGEARPPDPPPAPPVPAEPCPRCGFPGEQPPDPFPDPPAQATAIEHDLQAARERLSWTMGVSGNAGLGAIRHTATRVVNYVAAAIDRGDVDEHGAARVYQKTLAASAGISPAQLGRHLNRLENFGFITKRVSRTTDDAGAWTSATYLTLTAAPTETLQRLATFTPAAPPKPLRKTRRCPACGSTRPPVCPDCGSIWPGPDDEPPPAGDESTAELQKAHSEDDGATSPLSGVTPMPQKSNSAEPGTRAQALERLRTPEIQNVPEAISADDGEVMGDCVVCGEFGYLPHGAAPDDYRCTDHWPVAADGDRMAELREELQQAAAGPVVPRYARPPADDLDVADLGTRDVLWLSGLLGFPRVEGHDGLEAVGPGRAAWQAYVATQTAAAERGSTDLENTYRLLYRLYGEQVDARLAHRDAAAAGGGG